MEKGGNVKIFRRKFLVSQFTMPKNTVGEPFCAVSQKISGSQKVYGWGGGGDVSIFSVENVLSHSAEIFRRATL